MFANIVTFQTSKNRSNGKNYSIIDQNEIPRPDE